MFLPFVVDISGAKIKPRDVISQKILYHIHEKSSTILKNAKTFATFCGGYGWSWRKTHSSYQSERIKTQK